MQGRTAGSGDRKGKTLETAMCLDHGKSGREASVVRTEGKWESGGRGGGGKERG